MFLLEKLIGFFEIQFIILCFVFLEKFHYLREEDTEQKLVNFISIINYILKI